MHHPKTIMSVGRGIKSIPVLRPRFCVVFANIFPVLKPQRTTRRRLHSSVRKTILSYYSAEEAANVVKAAEKQRMTISNFVASAALKQAELVNSKSDKKH